MEQESKQNKNDRIFLISILISNVLLIVLVVLAICNFNSNSPINNEPVEQDQPTFEQDPPVVVEDVYCLKDYNGKIGIFKNEALVYTIDIYIFKLPEKDKKLLADGIEVSTKEELYELIELYY